MAGVSVLHHLPFSIISVLRIKASSLSAHPPLGLFLGLLTSCLALRTSKNTYLKRSENGFEHELFPAEQARHLSKKIEFVYTPTHGSWLNMVEIEISVLVRQCLKRRIPDIETLRCEAEAWCGERNRLGTSVDWRFTTADARIKLRKLYPTIEK
jgi:DDE superfamily endonuclease